MFTPANQVYQLVPVHSLARKLRDMVRPKVLEDKTERRTENTG